MNQDKILREAQGAIIHVLKDEVFEGKELMLQCLEQITILVMDIQFSENDEDKKRYKENIENYKNAIMSLEATAIIGTYQRCIDVISQVLITAATIGIKAGLEGLKEGLTQKKGW